MRAFVGIHLPPLPALSSLLEDLRGCGADLKVVDERNLHFTLKFLGDIPDAQADPIVSRLRKAEPPTGYRVVVRDVGAFPDWKKLNVLWAGLEDPEGNMARTFAITERVFAELGFPVEARPFSPHVTIARKRSDRGRDAAKAVLQAHRNESFGDVGVAGPTLFRSTLTPQGPIYEAVGGVA